MCILFTLIMVSSKVIPYLLNKAVNKETYCTELHVIYNSVYPINLQLLDLLFFHFYLEYLCSYMTKRMFVKVIKIPA
jgi:hypothetical protein